MTRRLEPGLAELTELVGDCCGLHQVALVVEVAGEGLEEGADVRVAGRWEPGTGAGYRTCARLRAARLLAPLPPREHDGERA